MKSGSFRVRLWFPAMRFVWTESGTVHEVNRARSELGQTGKFAGGDSCPLPNAEILLNKRHHALRSHISHHAQNRVIRAVIGGVEVLQVLRRHFLDRFRSGRYPGGREVAVERTVESLARQEAGIGSLPLEVGHLAELEIYRYPRRGTSRCARCRSSGREADRCFPPAPRQSPERYWIRTRRWPRGLRRSCLLLRPTVRWLRRTVPSRSISATKPAKPGKSGGSDRAPVLIIRENATVGSL